MALGCLPHRKDKVGIMDPMNLPDPVTREEKTTDQVEWGDPTAVDMLDIKVSKGKEMIKISLVILIPVISLIAIAANALYQSVDTYKSARNASAAVQESIRVADLIGRLQIERGLTAMFLGSNKTNVKAFRTLSGARRLTDELTVKLSLWRPLYLPDSRVLIKTRDDFRTFLNEYRIETSIFSVTVNRNILFYTEINRAFLDDIATSISFPGQDKLLVAFNSVLRAADAAGIQRALGSTYFASCEFLKDNRGWFYELLAETDMYLEELFKYHSQSRRTFREQLDELAPLEEDVGTTVKNMLDESYKDICMTVPLNIRYDMGSWWFDNMTSYINQIAEVRNRLIDDIQRSLTKEIHNAQRQFILYSVIMVLVIMASAVTLYFINKMTSKMQDYAADVLEKTLLLREEKQLTEGLLYQMLPRAVADQLKADIPVQAEYYDAVSIYFSDIVGFTMICTMITPHQVIDLLNGLYSLFDTIIDRYNVYKVETIGDAYMVSSGLPERDVDNHAREIALLSLDVQRSVINFRVPSISGGTETVRIRIGLHSGACAAGIVGVKMPRYCLFGDTVNTASRMESTGEAYKIHISETTKLKLEKSGEFGYERRGTITVKGKGEMTTYWLTSYSPKEKVERNSKSEAQQPLNVKTLDKSIQSDPTSGQISNGVH